MEINFIEISNNFLLTYKIYIFWLGTISLFIFIFSLISIKWLAAQIPTNYFIDRDDSEFKKIYPFLWLISIIIKSIC